MRCRSTTETVLTAKGVRYILEALVKNSELSNLDPKRFCVDEEGHPAFFDVDAFNENTLKPLKDKSHIIIGHNMFTDMAFLYQTFFGDLPQTVVEFSKCIGSLFPTVFDTKYMSTHGLDSMQPRHNLKDLYIETTGQRPTISLHRDHLSYIGSSREHEAGYDSEPPYAVCLCSADKLQRPLDCRSISKIILESLC